MVEVSFSLHTRLLQLSQESNKIKKFIALSSLRDVRARMTHHVGPEVEGK